MLAVLTSISNLIVSMKVGDTVLVDSANLIRTPRFTKPDHYQEVLLIQEEREDFFF